MMNIIKMKIVTGT